ncbi:hypothetical protein [Priestia aryabhattai]|uniref:hypothetical protein n=1 Tax=Priestia aryabhattai TaxID=412384 RepID=UPI001C8EEB5A|nr:hypothetical protein [Priestia aryabhattai]MBX9997319.1 hypothetical protein [Priestia aryabhattai]
MSTISSLIIGALALVFITVIFIAGVSNMLLTMALLYGLAFIIIMIKYGWRRGSITALIYLFIFVAIYYLHEGLQAFIRYMG